MGDISAEPSMEEILSSIKRIIAEEGDGPVRPRRTSRPSAEQPAPASPSEEPEVLELDTPVPPQPAPSQPAAARIASTPALATQPATSFEPMPAAEPTAPALLSRETAAASRDSLDALSRLLTRPEPGSDGTLEGLVREMLRPMLREWLDAHLPAMVEHMVAREIAKISTQG